MIVYHGSPIKDLVINPYAKSRYGMVALFFATNIELAQLYAIYHAKQKKITTGGFVYRFIIDGHIKEYDFCNRISYSADYRNLIYKLHRSNCRIARIKNVFDYPSKSLKRVVESDVVVVFDLGCIKTIELIQRNVRMSSFDQRGKYVSGRVILSDSI